ncbi:hypothetical protein NMG60_11006896 [Bertholletia excelsa]
MLFRNKNACLDSVFEPLRDFGKDSARLVKRCHKPYRKVSGFTIAAVRTAIGIVVMSQGFRQADIYPD